MAKVLKYFRYNGLAEPIRYILLYTDQKFDDMRYGCKTWPIKEVKDTLPFGQFPVLEDRGRVLHQSLAIARYVSANTELLPSDPWEQAVLDAVVHTIYDFNKHVIDITYTKNPEARSVFLTKFDDEHLDYYFSRFEKHLKDNNGYFGSKLSWADFVFVGNIECCNSLLQKQIQTGYSATTKLMEKIQSLPRVKEYIRDKNLYKAAKQPKADTFDRENCT